MFSTGLIYGRTGLKYVTAFKRKEGKMKNREKRKRKKSGEVDDGAEATRTAPSMRHKLEQEIASAKSKLYKLREQRSDVYRLSTKISNSEIVLVCDEYKFAYGDDYTYCDEHSYNDCGCDLQELAFIGYKFVPGYKEYPFFTQSDHERAGLDRFEFFLLHVGKALNFEKFRKEIKEDDE